MAAPTLRIKRGTTSVASPTAVPNTTAGEPIVRYNTDQGKYDGITEFHIGDDGATSSKLIADSGATAAANEILTKFTVESADGAADGVNASVKLTSMDVTGASITIDVPDEVATSYNFTLPNSGGTNGFVLQTDGAGNTSWVTQNAGYTSWTLSDGTTTQTIEDSDTVIITGGSGIDATVSATDTLTIDLNIDELTALDAEGGTDPLVVADSIAVYDASATANKKVSITNLESVIFADVTGDIAIAANGAATIQANSVELGTDTTGQYASTIAGGSGIAATTANGDDGTAYTIDLDINGLTADTIVDADELAFYDASGTDNNKITASNLASYISTTAANTEAIQDVVGGQFVTNGTHTNISFVYDDAGDGAIDATVATATTSTLGVASFDSGDFSVSSGAVSLADSATGAVIAINGTSNEVEVSRSNGTVTVGLPNDVIIAGNLTVNGTTTTVNTTNTVVSDALIELANGSSGTQGVDRDAGIVIERGDDTNVFFGYDEGDDLFVAGTTSATGATNGNVAPTPITFLALQYNVTDTAGTNEAVVSYLLAAAAPDGATAGRYLQNITVDAGTY